jgi:hypothetical protein
LLDGPENAATNEAQQADDASDDANGSERRIGAGLLALVGGVGGLGDFGLVGFRIGRVRSFRLSGRGCLSYCFGVIDGCGVCGGGGGAAGAASWALAIVPEKPKLIAIVKVTSVLRTPRD